MTNESPWSNEESLSRLSRREIGIELSTRVAEKLVRDNGKRGLWHSHRDYCGHGLVYADGKVRLIEVRDGRASEDNELKVWDNTQDFADWLARQSDYTLSGADENESALHTTISSNLNNQRITRLRLLDYVLDCTKALMPFRDFLIALDKEFRFLEEEYGFTRVRPRMDGRECIVRYRKARVAAITVMSEFRCTPYITVTLYSSDESAIFQNKSLNTLAKQRIQDWEAPEVSKNGWDRSAYEQFLAKYADLLRGYFPDLLMPQVTADSVDSSETAKVDSGVPETLPSTAKTRLYGAAIAAVAFLVLVFGLRYLIVHGTPEASGSPRGNLGTMILLSFPWVVLAVGLLQALTGLSFSRLSAAFSTQTIARRLGLGVVTVSLLLALTWLAASLA